MERRKFLGLLGIGALGTVAASDPTRTNRSARVPDDEVPMPTAGAQRIIWSVDTQAPAAALTFDDGPDPEFTPRILDILARHDTRATFLVMGYNAVRYPDLVRRVVEEGHEIGSHGWSHLSLAEAGTATTRTEIETGTQVIEEISGLPIRVFRPPYGRFNGAAVELLAHSRRDLVVWSVTRGDLGWNQPGKVTSHVVDALGPGDIVDLHDGIGRGTFNPGRPFTEGLRRRRAVEVEALSGIIEGANAKGLRLETVSELTAR